MGGMTKAIESGMAKMRIEEAATRKQARIDSLADTVVGVNKYRLEKPETVDVLRIDNTVVREKQIKRLEAVKASRDNAAVKAALEALTAAARADPRDSNLLELAVKAARARATLGEISSALEVVFGRHAATSSVVQGAYTASYARSPDADDDYNLALREVKDFEKQFGRRPRMLVAKMGQDGHDRGAKVIASGFSDLGYDVDVGPLFSTPEEAAQQAIDADVHVVGVSSQAAGHKTLVPALIRALRERGGQHIKVVAGGVIPPQDYADLYEAGVLGVFGPGTRISTCARQVLEAIRK